jgi:hypothetical protein
MNAVDDIKLLSKSQIDSDDVLELIKSFDHTKLKAPVRLLPSLKG